MGSQGGSEDDGTKATEEKVSESEEALEPSTQSDGSSNENMDWMICVLEKMSESLGDDEGGVLVCIQEAIEDFRKTDDKLPQESKSTVPCQHIFKSILVSQEFVYLCDLLLLNFHGIKVENIFPLKHMSSSMKAGVYKHSPSLFLNDMQEVWSKLLGLATELIPLSKSLSEISRTCKEEVKYIATCKFREV